MGGRGGGGWKRGREGVCGGVNVWRGESVCGRGGVYKCVCVLLVCHCISLSLSQFVSTNPSLFYFIKFRLTTMIIVFITFISILTAMNRYLCVTLFFESFFSTISLFLP